MTALTAFLLTAALAFAAHQLFRVLWNTLPRWGVQRTGRIAVLGAVLVVAVVLLPQRDAGLLGFVAGGVVVPMLLTKRRPARR